MSWFGARSDMLRGARVPPAAPQGAGAEPFGVGGGLLVAVRGGFAEQDPGFTAGARDLAGLQALTWVQSRGPGRNPG